MNRKQLTRSTLKQPANKTTRAQAEEQFSKLLAKGGNTLDTVHKTPHSATTSKSKDQSANGYISNDNSKRAAKQKAVVARAKELVADGTGAIASNQKIKKDGRGGERAGAGRPRMGLTKKTTLLIAQLAADGMSPLEFMLTNMRNVENPLDFRSEMAKGAAPYIHPKLSSTEVSGAGGKPLIPAITGTVPVGAAEAVQYYKDLLG